VSASGVRSPMPSRVKSPGAQSYRQAVHTTLSVALANTGRVVESGSIKSMSDVSERDEGTTRDGNGPAIPRHTRRLSDKVLVAFHHACDTSDLEVAEQLLGILEMMLSRRSPNPDSNRRRSIESLVAAYERLWHLRHPETDQ